MSSGFCANTSFSQGEFGFAAPDTRMEVAAVVLRFGTLFKVENPEFDAAIEFIDCHRKVLWPPQHVCKMSKEGVMLEISLKILAPPLCTEVFLERWHQVAISTHNSLHLVDILEFFT